MLNKTTVTFLSTLALVGFWSSSAFAQDVVVAPGSNVFSMYAIIACAAGFAIGIAALGGAFGQARAAAAALEGIARNPGSAGKLFTPLILGLALIESLVIYAFVIAILMVNKIDMNVVTKLLGQ